MLTAPSPASRLPREKLYAPMVVHFTCDYRDRVEASARKKPRVKYLTSGNLRRGNTNGGGTSYQSSTHEEDEEVTPRETG